MQPLSIREERRDSSTPRLLHGTSAVGASVRKKFPSVTTGSNGAAIKTTFSQNDLDLDQKMSAALETVASPMDLDVVSDPWQRDFLSVHHDAENFDSPSDISISPAAAFLSSFSPVSHSISIPDAEGETVLGYTLGPVIGHGGFSVIRRASSAQGGVVAIKIVRKSDLNKQSDPSLARRRLDHEAAVWASLSHEHILPLFSETRTLYADFFVTLLCPAGSLFDILKRDGRPALPQDDVGMMFRQIVRGLRYLHEVAGYVHGDMKLENVLVDEMGVCRIGDFGMARKIGEIDEELDDEEAAGPESQEQARLHRMHPSIRAQSRRSHSKQRSGLNNPLSVLRHRADPRHRNSSPFPASQPTPHVPVRGVQQGSLPYAAPELLLPIDSSTPYSPDPAQDIWALGVMLYTLLTGRLPFMDSFEPRLQMKILHGAYSSYMSDNQNVDNYFTRVGVFDLPKGIGRGAERVLQGCIERSVPNRWTIATVDEVAYSIGWGPAGDDVTPPPELVPSRTSSSSRSRSRPHPKQGDEVIRSSSRTSSSRGASRHVVHPPYDLRNHRHHTHLETHLEPTQPSLSALADAILRTNSGDSDTSSSAPTDSALLLTPGRPERGRTRQLKGHSHVVSVSRSSSPWEAPRTPQDIPSDMRGRKGLDIHLGNGEYSRALHDIPVLDHTDDTPRWMHGPETEGRTQSLGRGAPRSASSDQRKHGNGSVPPGFHRLRPYDSPFPHSPASNNTPRSFSQRTHAMRSRSMDGPSDRRISTPSSRF